MLFDISHVDVQSKFATCLIEVEHFHFHLDFASNQVPTDVTSKFQLVKVQFAYIHYYPQFFIPIKSHKLCSFFLLSLSLFINLYV